MRSLEAIGGDLRLVTAVRRSVIEDGNPAPRLDIIDQLLEERSATAGAEW
jgi:hypothetical protein